MAVSFWCRLSGYFFVSPSRRSSEAQEDRARFSSFRSRCQSGPFGVRLFLVQRGTEAQCLDCLHLIPLCPEVLCCLHCSRFMVCSILLSPWCSNFRYSDDVTRSPASEATRTAQALQMSGYGWRPSHR
ncbi:hypothetical protein F2Q69_00036697 [Brassica cretica]|uniref:Uncharacterized protein n=1 Tax=Brassica cretica TaxID=69181 RepID=A0A8S9SFT0_BRACR|nr:hypothetical protein F2Q69_00036697 [Brassica cretica]